MVFWITPRLKNSFYTKISGQTAQNKQVWQHCFVPSFRVAPSQSPIWACMASRTSLLSLILLKPVSWQWEAQKRGCCLQTMRKGETKVHQGQLSVSAERSWAVLRQRSTDEQILQRVFYFYLTFACFIFKRFNLLMSLACQK